MRAKEIVGFGLIVCFALMSVGADSDGCRSQNPAQVEAAKKALNRPVYRPINDLEFKNYERRLKVADDPTAILWCTSAFPIPNSPLFTVPVVGKLSSGSKRPFPSHYWRGDSYGMQESPDAFGMFGSSSDYRFGFSPTGVYADWTNMSLFCTTEPSVWQKESTTIVMESDPALLDAHNRAREILKQNGPNAAHEASKILEEAIAKTRTKPSSAGDAKKGN